MAFPLLLSLPLLFKVAPITIHPAFEKAAHYFGLKMVHVPVDEDSFLPNPELFEAAITKNAVLLACSAPQYCQGVIDPVEELGEIAKRRGVPLHVDACFGGFMLPWIEAIQQNFPGGRESRQLPQWDFRVEGVASMTADLHKYGYAPKVSCCNARKSGQKSTTQI